MLTYEPRSISALVYKNLYQLKQRANSNPEAESEQKSQTVELYSYISTWGLLRLKAEEQALVNKPNKQAVIKCFFQTLSQLVFPEQPSFLCDNNALSKISETQQIGASEYLGLTGMGLQVAREFSFWAEALYPKTRANPTMNTNTSTLGGV